MTDFDAGLVAGRRRPGEAHRWKPSKGRLAATRRAVYTRDDWTCQLCARVFEPSTEALAGREAPAVCEVGVNGRFDRIVWLELDHIVPYRDGGEFRVANLRAACSPCNARRNPRRWMAVFA